MARKSEITTLSIYIPKNKLDRSRLNALTVWPRKSIDPSTTSSSKRFSSTLIAKRGNASS